MTLAPLPGYGQLDPLSACAVEEWVRRGSLLPVENVPVAAIRNSYTPRKNKANESHVQVLAQSPLPLPPIVIHRGSMRVIDGVHRLRATELRGHSTIAARLFEGNDAEAFALAVHLNVTHGLPLTLAERKAAAQRVLQFYPHWSDRSIGLIAGVSNKTVGKLRGCTTEEISQLNPRLGRDGKVRPVSPANGRRRAAEFLSLNPRASLREIARKAGVSVTTARDVRQRIDKGESPLPDNLAKKIGQPAAPVVSATSGAAVPLPANSAGYPDGHPRAAVVISSNDSGTIPRSGHPSGGGHYCDCCRPSWSRSAPATNSPRLFRFTARVPSPRSRGRTLAPGRRSRRSSKTTRVESCLS